MPTITLSGVRKSYVAGLTAVHGLDLTIPDGAFMCLLGPSGCGKTTTLRMIAGLEQLTAGEIRVGERILDSVSSGSFVPTEKREMGFVFQSYALWPHLTVRRNVDFGLRLRKVPRSERDSRADEAMRRLQIAQLADRYPAQLSGGQQQRVSLARMLAVSPEVLLLDEPLSNLDAQLRLEMRAELKSLHATSNHTVVFVTHDQLEAMTMATHVAVMSQGHLQQVGPPLDVYNRPANLFVAGFLGSPAMNLLPVTPSGADAGQGPMASALLGLVRRSAPEVADRVRTIGLRPEALYLSGRADGIPDGAASFPVPVKAVLPTGSSWVVSLPADRTAVDEAVVAEPGGSDRTGGGDVYSVAFTDPGVSSGDRVTAWVQVGDLHLFDAAGDRIGAWDDVVASAGRAPAAVAP